ncbi:hypothetical protein MVEN_02164100 [Mycena venus]|uniref:Uncharacterized protein n=1 Tax=Mycena venus TaxID=2733690 RepID=A0A8H6X834_9AGAR|nr:hypothetical protein MVEN_02164100 [Mycena venus]
MSTDPTSSPLQDRTNLAPSSSADLERMEKEIAHLKGLVDAFSSRRGRGRTKRARRDPSPSLTATARSPTGSDDDDSEDIDPKRSKTTPGTDYFAYGQTIGRFLGCHVTLSHVVSYGCHMDTALSGDEAETNERLEEAWKILCQKFAGLHQYLLELSKDPTTRRAIVKQMTLGMDSVRAADTSTCKKGVPDWLLEDPLVKLDPPLPNKKDKVHRAMAHPAFAQALTPMEWEANQITWTQIVEGDKQISSTQLPKFVFPCSQVFPVGKELDDPAWGAVLENACKGEVCLRSAKAIFMGPDAALEGDGYHKGKPGNASIIGMTTFTPRIIAGVITQVRFALSSRQDWNKMDGDFDYEEFFWTIHDLFDDQDFAAGIIRHWNKVVFGNSKPRAAAPTAVVGPSNLDKLKAARAAHKAAAAAASE